MPTGGQDPASPLAVKQGGLVAAAVPRSGRRALTRRCGESLASAVSTNVGGCGASTI